MKSFAFNYCVNFEAIKVISERYILIYLIGLVMQALEGMRSFQHVT